jgi:TP901 family phage tail tape measure protein
MTTAAEQMAVKINQTDEAVEQLGETTHNSSIRFSEMVDQNSKIDSLKSTIAQFVGWTGATKALSAAMRNAFADIQELDKAMTEIAVVTDFSVGDMWDQLPEYTQRANELGVSIVQAYEASALFYQQGLDTNEMIELSNETLKMARIAGLEASEATDRMTAALRGFNMELNQANAQKIADVYSELAAITASDVDEISSAMTKTASIASSAGMEFETTAAFLSQIIETTRESAETAGTAMKTVIARFQELKKDPAEIGEIDGEVIDANKIETALRSVGVSLRDAGG